MLSVGDLVTPVARAVIGSDLELIPQQDALNAGPLALLVRFRGQPLVNWPLERLTHDAGQVTSSTFLTGPDGHVIVTTPDRGVHHIRGVHMVRCEGCPDADWHSFWTSLVFASHRPNERVVAPIVIANQAVPQPPHRARWAALLTTALVALVLVVFGRWRRMLRGAGRR